jgi:hypothetical protein
MAVTAGSGDPRSFRRRLDQFDEVPLADAKREAAVAASALIAAYVAQTKAEGAVQAGGGDGGRRYGAGVPD